MRNGKRKRKRRQKPSGASGPSKASRTPGTSPETVGPPRAAEPSEAAKGSSSGDSIKPWWEREVGRLEFELEQLDKGAIKYRIDEAAKDRGLLVLDLEVSTSGAPLQLQALFPDFYPYFRFEIRAPDLDLRYHQHPFSKHLCVLGRATENWRPSDTLAGFIHERVPQVLASSTMNSRDEAGELEEHQGEPFSDYYSYLDNSMILIDSSWELGIAAGGWLTIGFPKVRQRGLELRGAVLEVRDRDNHIIAKADPAICRILPETIKGRWIRTQEPIRENQPELFWDEICKLDRGLEREAWQPFDGFRYDVVGVVFPEEHRWRSDKTDGWVFATRAVPIGGDGNRYAFLSRAGRAGRSDLTERTPELNGLNSKTVVVVGDGAIGGPSCLEMARAGVGELRILDYDFVDPATTARWPLGISAAGLLKGDAIHEFIASNYPYTKVSSHKHRIGLCRQSDETPSDVAVLRALIDGADLIYDASAEIGINHLLSDMATEHDIPYISASTTYGAWGGRLIRVRPGITEGCWMCYFSAVQNGQMPLPLSDPNGEVQPAGCADPTFTGTGFDVSEIALAGVRLAIGTLQGSADGYPDVDWDVAVIGLRDDRGRISYPTWEVFPLELQSDCQNVRAHSRKSVDAAQSFAASTGRSSSGVAE